MSTTALLDLDLHLDQPTVTGALHLYPLIQTTTDGPAQAPGYVPGPEATDAFEVSELKDGPSVPQLDVTNHAGRPVLLVEGETLLGGLQNRTLNVTVLLAAETTTRIPVSCVEAGRWGRRRKASRSTRHSPTRLRARKTESVNRSVAAMGHRLSDQTRVWSDVATYAAAYKVDSASKALEDVHEAVDRRVRPLVDELEPTKNQVGVVVAIAGRPVALEVFDQADTLAAYWHGLIRGYALDAYRADPDAPVRPDRALRFLRRVAKAPATRIAGVGLGEELHLDSDRVTGSGLSWEGRLRHLAAFRRN